MASPVIHSRDVRINKTESQTSRSSWFSKGGKKSFKESCCSVMRTIVGVNERAMEGFTEQVIFELAFERCFRVFQLDIWVFLIQ